MKAINPPSLCPRFDRCSVNNCPLDPVFPNLPVLPGDKEKVCPMEKGVRARIGAQFPELLKMGGLTQREWLAKQRYERLPVAVKVQMAERGKEALKALRASAQRQSKENPPLPPTQESNP